MKVELVPFGADDAHVLENLWPLYQHDVSEFDASVPNRHGIFGADDGTRTLAEHARSLRPWWSDRSSLFAYRIAVDGAPAGFNLIAARSRLPREIDADFVVHEFFVLHAFRGKGVAERAAVAGFELHRGRWEVVTYPTHARGIAFWRRTISRYAPASFSEQERADHPWGRRVCFRFENAD